MASACRPEAARSEATRSPRGERKELSAARRYPRSGRRKKKSPRQGNERGCVGCVGAVDGLPLISRDRHSFLGWGVGWMGGWIVTHFSGLSLISWARLRGTLLRLRDTLPRPRGTPPRFDVRCDGGRCAPAGGSEERSDEEPARRAQRAERSEAIPAQREKKKKAPPAGEHCVVTRGCGHEGMWSRGDVATRGCGHEGMWPRGIHNLIR